MSRAPLYEGEHEDFRKTARTFFEREVVPHHAQWEADGIVPRELWTKAGDAGLLCFDVAEPYGDVVYLADDPDEFVRACRRALSAPAEERADRAARMREVLARTSWDATARAMADRVDDAVAVRLDRRNRRLAAGA